MLKRVPLLYYSASTQIAHHVNTLFYGKHYLWCAPVFDPMSLNKLDPMRKIPASSSPNKIYKSYSQDVKTGDTHSALIKQNKQGIKNGALFKLNSDEITQHEFDMINAMVDKASIADFSPILYIIPSAIVAKKVKQVSVQDVANPLGIEYKIEDLEEGEFEIIIY